MATCAQGSSVAVTRVVENDAFLAFWVLLLESRVYFRSTRWTGGSVSYIKVTKNFLFLRLQFELFFSNDAQQVSFQTVLGVLVYLLMCTRLGLRRCAYRWTRPLGGGRWEHYLRDPRGVHWFAQKCALCILGNGSNSIYVVPYMQASAGQPSLHVNSACMVCLVKGTPR